MGEAVALKIMAATVATKGMEKVFILIERELVVYGSERKKLTGKELFECLNDREVMN